MMEVKLPFTPEMAERFDGLFQLLSRKYKIEQIDLPVGKRSYRIFAVKNIDELLDNLVEAAPDNVELKDERLPYWAEIWPSSLALADFISESDALQKDAKVIEIGCGIGLAGLAAAAKGADVLLSDYQTDALLLSELNWLLNIGKSPATALMDWRQADLKKQFDIILASDVVYEKRFFYSLIDTFQKLLLPSGHIYLSEPNRSIARDFFSLLREEGFDFKKQNKSVPYRKRKVEVAVYDIRKKAKHTF